MEDLKQSTRKEIPTIYFRDYRNVSSNVFKAKLSELDWSLVTGNSEVNMAFVPFVRLVNRIFLKHAPTKVIEKKENK